jgi:cysteinyl-tRNA synthetase
MSHADIVFHNTLSGTKQVFVPNDPDHVTIYVCGPTVYNLIHIGNARPAVVFDVLTRLLRLRYPRVSYVSNITDIDDKINAAAAENGEDITTLAERFTLAYQEDVAALGVLPPDVMPKATHHITEIISMIETLIEQGHAYASAGHALFHVPSDPEYGSLAKRSLEDMIDGARVEVADYKKDPKDFVLWKPSRDDQPGWESPWGRGRPGWHIECSAMVKKHLGDTIDIHGGGSDLTFPHHENEAAQSRCANHGKGYVKYWLHNGMLNLGTEKMSKSLGNVLTIRKLLDTYSSEVLRYALLSGQYRSSLTWSDDLLAQARASLDSLYQSLRDTAAHSALTSNDMQALALEDYPTDVVAALSDDLNTPKALAAMHDLAAQLRRAENNTARDHAARRLLAGGWLLGLLYQPAEDYFTQGQPGDDASLAAADIESMIEQRKAARASGDYAGADRIRDELLNAGIELEDSREGTRWRKI